MEDDNTEDEKEETKIKVKRCQKNMYNLKCNKIYSDIIITQMECSKLIYNKGLYCQRTWFSRVRQIIIGYYISNIDLFLMDFSTADKILLFKIFFWKRDVDGMNKILSYIRNWESADFDILINIVKQKIDNCNLIDPIIIETDKISYKYDYQSIIDITKEIKTENFVDKYGDLREFIINLREALKIKIDNQIETLKNPNRKRAKKAKKIKVVKVKKDVLINKHLIPNAYLDISIVEQYVKIQFKMEKEKKNVNNDKHYDNPYEMIGSQVAQQTLKKLDEAYSSFFEKIKKEKASPPRYLDTMRFVLVFQGASFRIDNRMNGYEEETKIKLSLGNTSKKELKKKDSTSDGFMYFDIPPNIKDMTITEIELVPHNDQSIICISYKYNKYVSKQNESNGLNIMSIDLGQVNLATIYSPALERPLIYEGGYVKYVNQKYKSLIQTAQSRLKKENNKNISKLITKHWKNRELKIKDEFDKISANIINVCKTNGIKEIIIGYNVNWKHKVNMGRINNDMFYKIPYCKFINMLFYKGADNGIKVRENEESYTSKCDALNLETVEQHENYSGERLRRGLFQSAVRVLINADVNGAINIMRKALQNEPMTLGQLEGWLRNYGRICSPRIIKGKEYGRMP